eukprot:TRINITY_DN92654_c0_g1_i1.p1 TRINITY_DN92654_c0_g1~~TRINITY_DN92654_c0_g1_i1.p1  ORF type:complete len:286 (+),score=49.77 TRINITY_DN92654_c0_g1_i1:72-929(+)
MVSADDSETKPMTGPSDEVVFPFELAGMRDVGNFPVSLPCNTSGYAILAALGVYMPAALGQIVVLVFQAVLIYGVKLMTEDMPDHTCTDGNFALRVVCVCLFTIACLSDLSKTYSMHLWLQRLPASKRTAEGLQLIMFDKFYEDEDYKVQYPNCKAKTGITVVVRSLLYAFVLLPKVAVAVGLLVFGTPYVAQAAGNEAIIMNSVALAFVMDVDDMVFTFVATGDLKQILDSLPPLTLEIEEYVGAGSLARWIQTLWPSLSFVLPAAIVATILGVCCAEQGVEAE